MSYNWLELLLVLCKIIRQRLIGVLMMDKN